MTVLITGGAGYVGSHALFELRDKGSDCVVLDNLSRGHAELVGAEKLIVGDVGDRDLVRTVIEEYGIKAVMHFAAFAYVGESMEHPSLYYRNNVSATIELLSAIKDTKVRNVIFSSTCATYGDPISTPIDENHPQRPVNPYGASKLMIERILQDFSSAYGINWVSLRYFNAAGADPIGRTGERHEPETHLIPLALDAASKEDSDVKVFGSDYPTPDGSCVRDYVHVSDLAQAHHLALEYLRARGKSNAFNLGNGDGFSVIQVLDTAEKVTGRKIRRVMDERRPGDPHTLVGSAEKAKAVLGWTPRWTSLESIIETAWKWHQSQRKHIVGSNEANNLKKSER